MKERKMNIVCGRLNPSLDGRCERERALLGPEGLHVHSIKGFNNLPQTSSGDPNINV